MGRTMRMHEEPGCYSKAPSGKARSLTILSSPGHPHSGLLQDLASSGLRAPPALRQGRGSRAGSRLPPAWPPPPTPPRCYRERGREPGRAAIMLSRLGALLQEAVGAVRLGRGRTGGAGAGWGWGRAAGGARPLGPGSSPGPDASGPLSPGRVARERLSPDVLSRPTGSREAALRSPAPTPDSRDLEPLLP